MLIAEDKVLLSNSCLESNYVCNARNYYFVQTIAQFAILANYFIMYINFYLGISFFEDFYKYKSETRFLREKKNSLYQRYQQQNLILIIFIIYTINIPSILHIYYFYNTIMILIIYYLILFSFCQLLDTFPDTSQTLAI